MEYREALHKTMFSEWGRLSGEEKIEVLQAVENRMACEQGRTACEVRSESLHTGRDAVTVGSFSPGENAIKVNKSQLEPGARFGSPEKLVDTVVHEGRHCYQHAVAEGRLTHGDVMEAQAWRENLAPGGYIRFSESPRGYYSQPVEVDARSYSQGRCAAMDSERAAFAEAAEGLGSTQRASAAFENTLCDFRYEERAEGFRGATDTFEQQLDVSPSNSIAEQQELCHRTGR